MTHFPQGEVVMGLPPISHVLVELSSTASRCLQLDWLLRTSWQWVPGHCFWIEGCCSILCLFVTMLSLMVVVILLNRLPRRVQHANTFLVWLKPTSISKACWELPQEIAYRSGFSILHIHIEIWSAFSRSFICPCRLLLGSLFFNSN